MGYPGSAQIISKLFDTEFVYGKGFKKVISSSDIDDAMDFIKYC